MAFDWTAVGKGATGGAVAGTALGPWGTAIGGIAGAVGAGISSAQAAEEERKRLEEEKRRFDWQQQMDKKGQFNTERQLGMNALTGMRGGFKEALYRALTKG
jgi:hypothetical protein